MTFIHHVNCMLTTKSTLSKEIRNYSTLSINLFFLHYSANQNSFPPYYDRTSVSVSLVYRS